jgi:predicted hydrocarbon binding protein
MKTPFADTSVGSRVLDGLMLDPERGELALLDVRVYVGGPETLVALQKELESTLGVSAAAGMIYRAAQGTILHSVDLFARLSDVPEVGPIGSESFHALEEFWAALGFGIVRVVEADVEAVRFRFTIENGIFAREYGASDHPVCHWYRGWAAGFVKASTGLNLECVEERCEAQGHPRCEFRFRPLLAE